MENIIFAFLSKTPGCKAKQISKELGFNKSLINSLLYSHPTKFHKNENHDWFTKDNSTLLINFPQKGWISASKLEDILQEHTSLWSKEIRNITLVFNDCSFLLESLSRLLALINQLADEDKCLTLDFSDSTKAFSYLCRVGLFKLINNSVAITPKPKDSSSYYGNNLNTIEFGTINSKNPDENIPFKLKLAFSQNVGKQHANQAFTIISELFGNVSEHSKTKLDGFIALQTYKGKRKHIQTVISDSGVGIIGTIRPILKTRYPQLYKKYQNQNEHSDSRLIKDIFDYGKISSAENNSDESRGLGLKRSSDIVSNFFNATINIRQENFHVILEYLNGKLKIKETRSCLQKLNGTHICFDFYID